MTPEPISREQAARVQAALEDLTDRVETDPAGVLAELAPLAQETAQWSYRDPYLWCMHVSAQAFRFIDELDKAVEVARTSLNMAAEGSPAVPFLHLEAGMSLNQAGRQRHAEQHLRDAAVAFDKLGDVGGKAWALVSLAETMCGTGRPDDALPVIVDAQHAAESAGDERARLRALKQRAVIQRQRGDLPDALASIQAVLACPQHPHARANTHLEYGHILAHTQDYRAADDAYIAANIEYAAHNDQLGLANTERALATNDQLLDRRASALGHLNRAVGIYEAIGHDPGLAYVLDQRSLTRTSDGDFDGARADARRAVQLFGDCGDRLGLPGALRALARAHSGAGESAAANQAATEALTIARDTGSALAVAGALLTVAQVGTDAGASHRAALEAAEHYERVDVPIGTAHAWAFAAHAAAELGDEDAALTAVEAAAAQLHHSRARVPEPGVRADHDFSARDITARIYRVCATIDSARARALAADVIVDEHPLGLRQLMTDGQIDAQTGQLLARIGRVRAANTDPGADRSLLSQLAVSLSTLHRGSASPRLTFAALAQAHPESIIIAVGAPTPQGTLPVATSLIGADAVGFDTVALTDEHVTLIDALGHLADSDADRRVLFDATARAWQRKLTDVFIPDAVRDALARASSPPMVTLVLSPVIAHVPVEALMVNSTPLGVAAAARRLPVPTARVAPAHPARTVAYFDPGLPFAPEHAQLSPDDLASDPAQLRSELGPGMLIVAGCHGEAGIGLSSTLHTSDGQRVLSAADLLGVPLTSSVVVLEACWSGRYFGHRSGEQLTLAVAALLAGASDTVAALFAVPADDECTGVIVSHLLMHLRTGVAPAEALRRARAHYLDQRRGKPIAVPGTASSTVETMDCDAPWAWAGLCAYG